MDNDNNIAKINKDIGKKSVHFNNKKKLNDTSVESPVLLTQEFDKNYPPNYILNNNIFNKNSENKLYSQ